VVRILRNSSGPPVEPVFDGAHGLAGRKPVRLATRKMCVSRRCRWPKAVLSTTLAVLRPTRAAPPVRRALPAPGRCAARQQLAGLENVARLGVVKADGFDIALQAAQTEVEDLLRGVRDLNSLSVTLLTPLSVDCAERITATSNSNGVV